MGIYGWRTNNIHAVEVFSNFFGEKKFINNKNDTYTVASQL